jgi:uncharacterized protein YciI
VSTDPLRGGDRTHFRAEHPVAGGTSRTLWTATAERVEGLLTVGQAKQVSEWIYFLHVPRDNFAETMTDVERDVWRRHFERLQRFHADGIVVLAGPTLGETNTGIVIFEAEDEEAAMEIMQGDPTIVGGHARGELRPFKVSLLRGEA